MAKPRDSVWYCDEHGQRQPAFITRAQTLVDGLPTDDSYDVDTVDLAVHREVVNDGVVHHEIAHGVVSAKLAKTAADQKTGGRWWPR